MIMMTMLYTNDNMRPSMYTYDYMRPSMYTNNYMRPSMYTYDYMRPSMYTYDYMRSSMYIHPRQYTLPSHARHICYIINVHKSVFSIERRCLGERNLVVSDVR